MCRWRVRFEVEMKTEDIFSFMNQEYEKPSVSISTIAVKTQGDRVSATAVHEYSDGTRMPVEFEEQLDNAHVAINSAINHALSQTANVYFSSSVDHFITDHPEWHWSDNGWSVEKDD